MPKTKKGQAVSCRRAQDDTPSHSRREKFLATVTPEEILKIFEKRSRAIESAKQSLENLIIDASYAQEPKRLQILQALYWGTHVSEDKLATYFGISGRTHLHEIVGPKDSPCSSCHALFPRKSRHSTTQCRPCRIRTASEEREAQNREYAAHTAERAEKDRLDRERINQLRDLPYAEYLKTDHWKGVSDLARKRARYQCELCKGRKGKLHVHHKTYANLGDEQYGDLIVLCETCHRKQHGKEATA